MYNEQMVSPMRAELENNGVEQLTNGNEVNNFLASLKSSKIQSAVVFINSVCGCAAGIARPGFIKTLSHKNKAKKNATVFAGVDAEATNALREKLYGIAPTSPSIAFFREGELVHFIERQEIEGSTLMQVQQYIQSIYEKFFDKEINTTIELKNPLEAAKISSEEVKTALNNKDENFLFYDCRSEEERKKNNNSSENSKYVKLLLNASVLLNQQTAEELVSMGDEITKKTVVFCSNNGERSAQAVQYFGKHGYENFKSLKDGISSL